MDHNNNIISPFSIKYTGKLADSHVMDATEFGGSLGAAAKIYNSVIHFCTTGEVPKGNYKKGVACFTEAPRAGCVEAFLYLAPVMADGYLFASSHQSVLTDIFWKVIDVLKKIWTTGSKEEAVTSLVEAIKEMSNQNAETQLVLANGLVSANQNLAESHAALIGKITELADRNRNHAREMVVPIGRSCSGIEQISCGNKVLEIAEPEAEAIKSKDDLIVGDPIVLLCTSISEINTKTGHCEIEADCFDGIVTGKITDPVLGEAGNIYTRSLDRKSSFYITAKPVMKGEKVHRLYISDARKDPEAG